MTNYEWIKSMSLEELADFISNITVYGSYIDEALSGFERTDKEATKKFLQDRHK